MKIIGDANQRRNGRFYKRYRRQLDVRIKDEKIIEMGCDLEVNEDKIIDASACYLFPGFIDGHTHLELENDLATTSDNFVTGSQAAVAKGTTTIIDMATPVRGSSLNNCLKTWNQMAEGKGTLVILIIICHSLNGPLQ